MKAKYLFLLFLMVTISSCATSPTGRQSLYLFPDSEMSRMGLAAYQEMKSKQPVSQNARLNRITQCVARAVTSAIPANLAAANPGQWQVTVFEDKTANAFALPGGNIGVHTGMFTSAKNQDQLAAVIGHEVMHVLARHSNERVSAQYASKSGMDLLSALSGGPQAGAQHDTLMGLLGMGVQVGLLMPYGRGQESEADMLGLDVMARAGFDPRQSIQLWMNMEQASQGQTPEFLSTHPSHSRRIQDLQARMPQALALYNQAIAQGRKARCGY